MGNAKPVNQAAIYTFNKYFADNLRLIGEVANHLYRKILFVGVLDTLSRAALPELKDKNRERFLGFVEGCGDWPDQGRVSLPQLAGNLERVPHLRAAGLAVEIRRRLEEEWDEGRIYHASDDPPKDELMGFATTPEEQPRCQRPRSRS